MLGFIVAFAFVDFNIITKSWNTQTDYAENDTSGDTESIVRLIKNWSSFALTCNTNYRFGGSSSRF